MHGSVPTKGQRLASTSRVAAVCEHRPRSRYRWSEPGHDARLGEQARQSGAAHSDREQEAHTSGRAAGVLRSHGSVTRRKRDFAGDIARRLCVTEADVLDMMDGFVLLGGAVAVLWGGTLVASLVYTAVVF